MELVMPDGGAASEALGLLRRAYAQRLLRGLVAPSGRSIVVKALVGLCRDDASAAFALVSEPTCSVLLETGRTRDALANLAFSLAVQGRLGAERRELPDVRRVFSLGHDLLVDAARGLAVADGFVHVDGVEIAIPSREAPVAAPLSRPFPTLVGDIRFARFDPNPLALDETHPEKDGNALSLGGEPESRWLDGLRAAFSLIVSMPPSAVVMFFVA